VVPAYLRADLPLDSGPARDVRDSRVKTALVMAPGDIEGFGMDVAGLQQLTIPTYIIVGARDTQATPKGKFGVCGEIYPACPTRRDARFGRHEIFVSECDGFGRDTWPDACVDAPGIDRPTYIGSAALKFCDTNLGVRRGGVN